MQFVYNTELVIGDFPSIFLAGPTPRQADVPSWRKQAVALFEKKTHFNGAVIMPEDRGFISKPDFEYGAQIEWERKNLLTATSVMFWIPRDLQDMPAFTTNIEFGFVSERDQPYVLGFPKGAPKMRYLEYIANKQGMPVMHDLEETIDAAIALCNRRGQANHPV